MPGPQPCRNRNGARPAKAFLAREKQLTRHPGEVRGAPAPALAAAGAGAGAREHR